MTRDRQAQVIELRKMKIPYGVRAARQETAMRLILILRRAIGFPLGPSNTATIIFNHQVEADECRRLLYEVSRKTRRETRRSFKQKHQVTEP